MKSRKCANYERHGWMEDAEDPRSFCTHCEIERLRAKEWIKIGVHGHTTCEQMQPLQARIDAALMIAKRTSLQTTSASVIGEIIVALEGE